MRRICRAVLTGLVLHIRTFHMNIYIYTWHELLHDKAGLIKHIIYTTDRGLLEGSERVIRVTNDTSFPFIY